jgi:hypothetical protein
LSACLAVDKRSNLQFMADIAHDARQEFWRSPTVPEPGAALLPVATTEMADACTDCGTEFMIGARFCHTCGLRRPAMLSANTGAPDSPRVWARSLAMARSWSSSAATSWQKISLPAWIRYLHFHEIKRWIGLPTASLISFMIGLGCVAGAIGVSLVYKASTLAEFQAIQMWRIEWLLAATASFVAGILLKKSTDAD